MSFSVKAVESPSPQVSPFMHPYVSPQVMPHTGQRVPSMSLADDHGPSKRVGTDPTKYKTTICRNWEQTGTCTFRGCTFAHGVEELRAPTRVDHGSTPHLHSQYVSPGSTPPLMAANGGAGHFGNGGVPKLEGLLDLLQSEVTRERELAQVHMEANRTLEAMLRREQTQHMETKMLLEERRADYAMLVDVVNQQNAVLQALLAQREAAESGQNSSGSGSNEHSPQAAESAQDLVERTTVLLRSGDLEVGRAVGQDGAGEGKGSPRCPSTHSSDAGDAKDKEKERIEELLRALQRS